MERRGRSEVWFHRFFGVYTALWIVGLGFCDWDWDAEVHMETEMELETELGDLRVGPGIRDGQMCIWSRWSEM